jgi:hypothetical protein
MRTYADVCGRMRTYADRRAILLLPDHVDALKGYGQLLVRRGCMYEAISVLKQASLSRALSLSLSLALSLSRSLARALSLSLLTRALLER